MAMQIINLIFFQGVSVVISLFSNQTINIQSSLKILCNCAYVIIVRPGDADHQKILIL